MARKIVTNLRIEEADWLQIKATAAEQGMSVNEYINFIIRQFSTKSELEIHPKLSSPTKRSEAPIWELGELAKKYKSSKKYKLSKEDEIIYGV